MLWCISPDNWTMRLVQSTRYCLLWQIGTLVRTTTHFLSWWRIQTIMFLYSQNYRHLLSYKNMNTRVSLLSLGPRTGTAGPLVSGGKWRILTLKSELDSEVQILYQVVVEALARASLGEVNTAPCDGIRYSWSASWMGFSGCCYENTQGCSIIFTAENVYKPAAFPTNTLGFASEGGWWQQKHKEWYQVYNNRRTRTPVWDKWRHMVGVFQGQCRYKEWSLHFRNNSLKLGGQGFLYQQRSWLSLRKQSTRCCFPWQMGTLVRTTTHFLSWRHSCLPS